MQERSRLSSLAGFFGHNLLCLAAASFLVVRCCVAQEDCGRLEVLQPELHRLIDRTSCLEKVASGFRFTEGPVWSPSGFLLFSDIHGDKIYRWSPVSGTGVVRDPAENPNGLTYDRQGRLLICEQKLRRLVRLEVDGRRTILADRWEGKALNCPNDVVVRRDNTVYFTDPYWKFPPGAVQELGFQAVFRVTPKGELDVAAKDFGLPNGIALSPDEKVLYVADSRRRSVHAFDVARDGSLSGQRVLIELQSGEQGAVDGMKVDELGNLYVTGPGGIWVLDRRGRHLGTIRPPELPANCAWGDPDFRSLYLTARTSVYRLRTRVRGKATYPLSAR